MRLIPASILFVCALTCCRSDKDKEYFTGKIKYADIDAEIVKIVTSKDVPVEDYGYGDLAVYDSLVIFMNPQFPAHCFGIFNIDTGKEIGYFCPKGKGPGELLSSYPVYQIFSKGKDILSLLYSFNDKKIFIWNISQSVMQGTTVYDTIVPFENEPRVAMEAESEMDLTLIRSSRYSMPLWYLSPDRMMAKLEPIPLSYQAATIPYYEERTIRTNEWVRDYRVFAKDSIHNGKISQTMRDGTVFPIPPDFLFKSADMLKPDGSKMVQAMRLLPQLNILDLRTGKVMASRLNNSPDFSLFETDLGQKITYYNSVQADDHYIYATYSGSARGSIEDFKSIHVFDWNGTLLSVLKTDRTFARVWLDTVRNRLYTTDYESEEVYYLDMNDIMGVR